MNDSRNEAAFELVQPNAAAMMQSLRAVGYSPQAAIADLVDNSISAGASNVWVTLYWDGAASYILVRDDGHGMNADEIRNAMRLGSRNPLEERGARDLGRFGLGLKTASFSQCRRLTVTSQADGSQLETRQWDLDYVNQTTQWRLLKIGTSDLSKHLVDELADGTTGTVVLWEKMDRIVGDSKAEDKQAQQRFLDVSRDIEHHLSMVFHRFLEQPGRLSIHVNGERIKGWDPFLAREDATQWLEEEVLWLDGQEMRVQPFVLPHHSKIDKETHREAAGTRGWNAQQGFYVYRNRRLLVSGDWLGLPFVKEEHYKLARILIDLPNSMDHDWQIDVRKSRAKPPGVLRQDLKRIASVTRERAASIYRHRGKVVAHTRSAGFVLPWQRRIKHGKIFYQINREHPLVSAILEVPEPYRKRLRAILRLVEETVPTSLIVIDHAQNPNEQAAPFEKAPSREVRDVLLQVYSVLRAGGVSRETARERILSMDPFSKYPELVASVEEITDTEIN